jgi:uncharacterized membrane protein
VSGVLEGLAPLASASLRYLPTLVLLWLALSFGRTLRAGQMPLIERVARIGKPALSAPLCRYTRGLTIVWCIYFVVAAMAAAFGGWAFAQASVAATTFSAVLFAGEHSIRRLIFPEESFPGLIQQIRDTVAVWRPRRGPQA